METLCAEYIQVMNEHNTIGRRLKMLRKKVTDSLKQVLVEKGKSGVCITQQNSEKVLELKTSYRQASYNATFVHDVIQQFIAANGNIDSANFGEFVAFADTERKNRTTASMRLSYRKCKRPQKAEEPDPMVDEFAAKV